MTPSSEKYRTPNLLLAAFLSYQGQEYGLMLKGDGLASWEFDYSQEVQSDSSAFLTSNANVEPLAYYHSVTRTRRVLFSFLKSKKLNWNNEQIKEAMVNAASD